jgi:hypothetical protein
MKESMLSAFGIVHKHKIQTHLVVESAGRQSNGFCINIYPSAPELSPDLQFWWDGRGFEIVQVQGLAAAVHAGVGHQ